MVDIHQKEYVRKELDIVQKRNHMRFALIFD